MVVFLVNDSLRTVAVQKVDCEKEGLRQEAKYGMNANEEVNEDASYTPLDLALRVYKADIRKSLILLIVIV